MIVNKTWINASVLGALIFLMSCSSGAQRNTINRTDTVIIQSMKFNPAEIKVNKGDTIVFFNKDFVQHDISNPDKAFYSDTINVGSSWKLTVVKSADYFCSIHPSMKGKIEVQP